MAEFKPSKITGDIDVSAKSSSIIAIGQELLVSATTVTTIVSMTANGFDHITKISCKGDDYAIWTLFVNSVQFDTIKLSKYSVDFQWDNPLEFAAGNIIDVKVEHGLTGQQLAFDATIYGFSGV